MAASSGTLGYSATLTYGDALGAEATPVAQVESVGLPNMEIDDVEITNMDSDDAMKEYIAGMIEGGEIEFGLVYTAAQTATLDTLFHTRASKYWKVALSDTSTFQFYGYMKACGLNPADTGDAIRNTYTIKLAGTKPTFTSA